MVKPKFKNGLTLDLVALLAFVILSISFLLNTKNPFLTYAIYLLIFSSYFLGKAIMKRMGQVLDSEDGKESKEVKKYACISINIILVALMLFVVFSFVNNYFIEPHSFSFGLDFEIKEYGLELVRASNTTSVTPISGLAEEQLNKINDGKICNITNISSLNECFSDQSPYQRISNNYWFVVLFVIDIVFLFLAFFFIMKTLDSLLRAISEKKEVNKRIKEILRKTRKYLGPNKYELFLSICLLIILFAAVVIQG